MNNKVWWAVVCAGFLLFGFLLMRASSERYLDDVTPGIPCEEKLLAKSDVLFVVPSFEGRNISEDKEWCAGILALNKTLAMHGVYHRYNEFGTDRDEEYVQIGAEEFRGCFGFYPNEFKAPQLMLSESNREMLEKDYKLDEKLKQITHKTYHCNDSGRFPNWLQDWL